MILSSDTQPDKPDAERDCKDRHEWIQTLSLRDTVDVFLCAKCLAYKTIIVVE